MVDLPLFNTNYPPQAMGVKHHPDATQSCLQAFNFSKGENIFCGPVGPVQLTAP